MQEFSFTREILDIAYNDFFKPTQKKKLQLKKIDIKKYSIDIVTAFSFILKILDEKDDSKFKISFLNEFKQSIEKFLKNSSNETRELVRYIIGDLAHEEIKSVYDIYFVNNIISFLIFDYVMEDNMSHIESKNLKKMRKQIETFFDDELIEYLQTSNISKDEKSSIDNSYEMASTLWELIKSMSITKMLLLRDKTKNLREKIISYLKTKEFSTIEEIAHNLNFKESEVLLALAYIVSNENLLDIYIKDGNSSERFYKYKSF